MISSLANVKSFLGITSTDHDTLLTALLDGAEDYVKSFCNREFEQNTSKTSTYDGDGASKDYLLEETPVNSITSVTVDSSTLSETDDYEIYAEEGIIHFYNAPAYDRKKIVIVYDAGYSSLDMPDAVIQAVNFLTAQWFALRGQRMGKRSERVGNYAVTFNVSDISKVQRDLVHTLLTPHILESDPNLVKS